MLHPSFAHLTRAPHTHTQPGALWEVNVKMQRWEVGAQLTIDFFGDQLKKHPLRIKSIEPDDAVEQAAARCEESTD